MSHDNTMVDMRWAFMLLGTNPVTHSILQAQQLVLPLQVHNVWICQRSIIDT